MLAVVTGGFGFVGLAICRRLAYEGFDVVAVDRSEPTRLARRFLDLAVERVLPLMGDICDSGWHAGAGRPDLLIHAAALTPLGTDEEVERATEAVAVNVGGTVEVMRWAAHVRPRRIVHVSSGSVYGAGCGVARLNEDDPHAPVSLYGITKSASERVAVRLAERTGLDLIVARPTYVYGPMERPSGARIAMSHVHDWCLAAHEGRVIEASDLRRTRDYTHANDIAEAVARLALLRRPRARTFNVSTGVSVRLSTILRLVLNQFPGAVVRQAPDRIGRRDSRPRMDVGRLDRAAGWWPRTTIRDGIRLQAAWLRSLSSGLGPASCPG
ncbi:MAG: NAD(P)-dependent oxidoreductase [Candidatus Dormibacteraeota bacterium]|uniref:NAD(P)-dependent oxidoreductase n=2 Tax=Candidatus Dormibacteria TaxID=3126996 RepID=A0A934K2B9_9BACT|nr:NAD(P)-dependent oxidoreductase [Candidatus Dormibacteraeota bacterium]MBJ7603968.1 NAD(P)-dependent oxidoreductase [Candidatus Dormibacteraeota bacterium]MBJ7607153.1 NAD(P)-dependent oxidoreductase [Candidatus Dormibacteraeota bacterium]